MGTESVKTAAADPARHEPTSDELSLEAGIRVCTDLMVEARCREEKREMFRLLADLHARRSPAMVAELERRQGIAR